MSSGQPTESSESSESSESTLSTASSGPTIRIESGDPTPEELAALVVVLAAAGGDVSVAPPPSRSAWADPAWRLVGPSATRGGWRSSGLPH